MKLDSDINPKLIDLYFHELFHLVTEVVTKCNRVFDLCDDIKDMLNPNGSPHFSSANTELNYNIQSILVTAANVRKIIQTPTQRKRGEGGKQHKLRQYRSKMLCKLIEDLELQELFNKKIRNTLEHYGEYLDKAIIDISKGNKSGRIITLNMQLSSKHTCRPFPYPIKTFVISECRYYNLDWSIDINRIHVEASLLLDRIKQQIIPVSIDTPGGVIYGPFSNDGGKPTFRNPLD